MARIPVSEAGYVELKGAVKDSDCRKVAVPGGISLELACCNFHHRENVDVTEFKCGTCEYKEDAMNLRDEATKDSFGEPLSQDDTSTPSFPAYKNNGLKGSHAGTPFRPPQIRIKSAPLAAAIARARRPGSHRNG